MASVQKVFYPSTRKRKEARNLVLVKESENCVLSTVFVLSVKEEKIVAWFPILQFRCEGGVNSGVSSCPELRGDVRRCLYVKAAVVEASAF